MNPTDVPGLVSLQSPKTSDELFAHILDVLQSKHLTVFALIDHSGNAAEVGMAMPFSKLILFGDPNAGTPLMQNVPTAAIDLPLKFLVWQDGKGGTWLSYNDPQYLHTRHGVSTELAEGLAGIRMLAQHMVS